MAEARVPAWIERLGVAIWVSGPDRRLVYLNRRAEDLLGVSAEATLGRPCYEVVGSRDTEGTPFCGPRCPLRAQSESDGEVEPVTVRAGEGADAPLLRFLVIPHEEDGAEGPFLVHCAWSVERTERMEQYLTRVASRSASEPRERRDRRPRRLTAREREVLDLLAGDEPLADIARRLEISHVTVRNHVQHILSKLGVHSIQEAVAHHLLAGDGNGHS